MQHAIRVAAFFVLLAFGAIPAHAQSFSIVELPGGCGTGNITSNSLSYLTVDPGLKLCVNATATLGGFTALTNGTPISVTTGGVSGTLPAGAEVVATNVGTTNGAYCALGASATTSSQYIAPNGGWFAFAVGASTQLTCITSTSTTTVNTTGGSGLPTGTGGGGGGSSSNASVSATGSGVPASATYAGMNVSGNLTGLTGTANGLKTDGSAVTQPVSGTFWQATQPVSLASGQIASGAYSSGAYAAGALAAGAFATGAGADGWDTTQGSKTDVPCTLPATATACSMEAIAKAAANALVGASSVNVNGTATGWTGLTPGSAQTGTIIAGNIDLTSIGGVAMGADPCRVGPTTTLPITVTTSTVKVIATGAASKKTYVCHLLLSSGAADNVAIFEATTGSTCATSPIAMIGAGTTTATAGNGLQFAANGGVNMGTGDRKVLITTVNNNDVCVGTSAATPLSGSITFAQQ